MEWNARLWKNSISELTKFMAPLVATLGRSERRRAATHYVEGLLIPGQRKSIEPMAARLGVDSQSLQQLLTSSPWSDEALWKAIRQEVIPHLEPLEAWVVDETGWLKQGKHSVGVSHQYCGAVGKSANCQVSVELVVSEGWVAAPIAAQLYLPRSWSEDAERRAAAGVPAEIAFHTKPELALAVVHHGRKLGQSSLVSLAPRPKKRAYLRRLRFMRAIALFHQRNFASETDFLRFHDSSASLFTHKQMKEPPVIRANTMATSPLASKTVTSEGRGLRVRRDNVFFCAMALVILGTVFLGFARSYYLAGVFHSHLPNLLVHVHEAVFSAWILLFIAQTSLVSAGRLDWHRHLGIFGAVLAGAMVVLGFLVATDSLARGFVPPGSRLDPKFFYSIPVFSTAVFCVLIVWALRARADGAAHKRLMLIATISLMDPAVNRWAFLPIAHRGLLTSAIVDFLILLVAGFDLWSRRRIHRATVQGGLFMMVAHQLMFPVGLTAVWHRFATLAENVWTGFR